ncbi:MAG: tetratricopeptide repeat protein [Sedimentisphaerales bacterium]|nr:tetratricopeptide repeat protein [Sedimentisphaerales bacterium]
MGKRVRNLLLGAGVAATAVAVTGAILLVPRSRMDPREVLESLAKAPPSQALVIEYPQDQTLFPPEIVAPTFRWKDGDYHSDLWLVTTEFADGRERINRFVPQSEWRPDAAVWEKIKSRSVEKPAVVTIVGVSREMPSKPLSAGRVTIQTSSDPVDAPLFYREVNLPFADAVKDPSTIRWRFGAVSSAERPPVVLENLPVCGNCHSFSADGAILGMDIDYANDKGSYAIAPVRKDMTLDKSAIITWSDYRRDEGEATFGLLSQVSPDGRFVVSTVKDQSVFVATPGLDFSQLFFPVKGILCVHDRRSGTFQSLPGADDPNLVQSNPTWSPDGRYILFAATKAHSLKRVVGPGTALLNPADCREFLVDRKPFKFNLFRIPFNGGQGGKPEPLAGASFNGKSNFFPKYSPDGKWIVFCQAENYMLLQPDSELCIIPAEGGQPRRLRANTKRMNSWHSFSPNGKWLVFSGKPDSPYTRLYLTHIDERGESTPPVVLDHLTAPDRAANIPEFVHVDPGAIARIREQFIDDVSYARAAWQYLRSNDYEGAERQAKKALELNPKNFDSLRCLGLALFGREQYDEAIRHLSEAAKLDPNAGEPQVDLGAVFIAKNMLDEGIGHLHKALKLAPNSAEACFDLGVAEFRRGNRQEAIKCWSRTVELRPDDYAAHHNLALALDEQGNADQALEHHRKAAQLKPGDAAAQAQLGSALCARGLSREGLTYLSKAVDLDPANLAVRYKLASTLTRLKQHDRAIPHLRQILRLNPAHTDALMCLAASYAETNQTDKALNCLEDALRIASSAGNQKLVSQITKQIDLCRQRLSPGKRQ